MKDLGMTVTCWQVLRMGDGRVIRRHQKNFHEACSCPEDIKKTLMRHAQDYYWQRCTTKHEVGEVTEGVWFDPVQAMFKNKAQSQLDGEACNISKVVGHQWSVDARKAVNMNRADSKKCKYCQAEGTEKHRLYHCSEWREERSKMPNVVRSYEMKAPSSTEDWTWQRRLVSFPNNGKGWTGWKTLEA